MAVCPVSFDEAYGEPSGPRLRATPFRSMGRDSPTGEPRDDYGPRASSNRLGVPGKGTRDPWDEEMALFACAATCWPRKGGRPAGRPYGRGEVLGWARALSPLVESRALPWVFGSSLRLVSGLDLESITEHVYSCVKGLISPLAGGSRTAPTGGVGREPSPPWSPSPLGPLRERGR